MGHVLDCFCATAIRQSLHVLWRPRQAEVQDAHEQWRAVADRDVLLYMAFPLAHWLQIHSTNPLRLLHAEIKRRTNVVGIFPTTLPSPTW